MNGETLIADLAEDGRSHRFWLRLGKGEYFLLAIIHDFQNFRLEDQGVTLTTITR